MSEEPSYLKVEKVTDELPFKPAAFELGNDDFETLVSRLIAEEERRAEDIADTKFEETSTTATLYDGDRVRDDGEVLLLPEIPIQSVTSVTSDGETLDVDEDVRVRETHLRLLSSAPVNRWGDEVEVGWSYGHTELPRPARDAIIRLVRSRLERVKSDGLESESLPTGQSASYRPPEEILSAAAATIRGYRPDTYDGGMMVI